MPARQYFFLQPLDVDFQPMNILGACLLKQGIKRQNWHQSLPALESARLVLVRNFSIRRGKTRVLELEERQSLALVADCQLEHGLVRARCPQQGRVLLGRLDMHATPAVLIKCEADRVNYRVLGTDINIKTIFDMLQRTPEHDIFKILCVGNETHIRVIAMFGSSQATPAKCGLLILTTLNSKARSRHS